jgi:cholesterol 7-dehydrogenase
MSIPWTTVSIPGISVLFDSSVVLGSEDGAAALGPPNSPHFLYFRNTSSLQFYGKDVPRTAASVTVQFIGPGSINRFLFSIPDLGEIVMFQTHLPLLENEGLAQRVRYQVSRCC